ncbi:hypothetical protein [Streptomyces sp. NPDC050504]|uniref:hypothetical protein n=1 Tax=Streptomyces sp. NPDC050504 TaxID=3365618 RepID=UPI00379D01CD
MDEMDVVRGMRADAPAPDRARLAPGRQRLLEAAARGGHARRLPGGRMLAAVATVAAVTGIVVLAAQLTGPEKSEPAEVVSEFEKAARSVEKPAGSVAAARPVAGEAPRGWTYRKYVEFNSSLFYRGMNKALYTGGDDVVWSTRTSEVWNRADIRDTYEKNAYTDDKLKKYSATGRNRVPSGWQIDCGQWGTPDRLRRKISGISTDPKRLREDLRLAMLPAEGTSMGSHYNRIHTVLKCVEDIPAPVHGALFRALELMPGATLSKKPVKDQAGRSVLTLSWPDSNSLKYNNIREEILLDPRTYAYLGERSVYRAGGTIDGKKNTADVLYSSELMTRIAVVKAPGRER